MQWRRLYASNGRHGLGASVEVNPMMALDVKMAKDVVCKQLSTFYYEKSVVHSDRLASRLT